MRTPRGAAGSRSVRPGAPARLATLGLAAALVLGLALQQAVRSGAIRSRMEAEAAALEARLSAARAAEGRLPELRQEAAAAERELGRLVEELPGCTGPRAELEGIRTRAEAAGLELSVAGTAEVRKDFHAEERLSLGLHGDDRVIDELVASLAVGPRLASTEVFERRPGTAAVVVTLFCGLDERDASREAASVRTDGATGVWLPPFRRRLEERGRALDDLRLEVARREAVLREVDAYRDVMARLRLRRELVKELRARLPGPGSR